MVTAALGLAVPAGANAGTLGEAYEKTCDHYAYRTEHRKESNELDYIADLAASCQIALVQVTTSESPSDRARRYLERLTLMRQTVTAININRFINARQSETPTVRFRPVSKTGEYLIARRIGAIAAYRNFANSADFQVSAAD
jgi:hypothetical protein